MTEEQKALLLNLFGEPGPESPPLGPEAQAKALVQAFEDYNSPPEALSPGDLVVEKNPLLTSRKPNSQRTTVLMFWRSLDPTTPRDEEFLRDWFTRFDHHAENFDCLLAVATSNHLVLFPSDSRFYRKLEEGELKALRNRRPAP